MLATCEYKLNFTKRLLTSQFCYVDFIEAGWPGSNPKDAGFFKRAQIELAPEVRSKLAVFGSIRRKNIHAKDDLQLQAVCPSQENARARLSV